MEVTISRLIFPASRAARVAISCKSVAVKFVNFPPKAPKGVLFAATMNTSLTATETILTLYLLRTLFVIIILFAAKQTCIRRRHGRPPIQILSFSCSFRPKIG